MWLEFFTTFSPRIAADRQGFQQEHVNPVKLDAMNEMLLLPAGCTVLDTNHPVCREYEKAPGKGIRPMFPSAGSAAVQVFTRHTDPRSETALFLKELGGFR